MAFGQNSRMSHQLNYSVCNCGLSKQGLFLRQHDLISPLLLDLKRVVCCLILDPFPQWHIVIDIHAVVMFSHIEVRTYACLCEDTPLMHIAMNGGGESRCCCR